jgi:hypothetical protein
MGVHLKTAFTLSLILALVGMIPGVSRAAEQDTAGMMAFCRKPVLTPDRTYCHGFFWGVFRVLTDEWIEGYPGLGVCPQDPVSNAQMARIFLLFAEAHPELRKLEPQRVAAQAFAEAFPCPKK